jgi:calcyphosin
MLANLSKHSPPTGKFLQSVCVTSFYSLFPKKIEIQALIKYYDLNKDGSISYDEFMNGLRDELNDRRRNMVMKAFSMLDKSGDGQITVADIQTIYDVSKNPDYLEGRLTKD